MRKAVVSLVTVMMFAAVFAMPTNAAGSNGSYNGDKFDLAIALDSDTVEPGGTIRGTVTLATHWNDAGRVQGSYRVALASGTGEGPGTMRMTVLRSANRSFPNNVSKTATFTQTVNSHIPAGDYVIYIDARIGGERAVITQNLRVAVK